VQGVLNASQILIWPILEEETALDKGVINVCN